MNAWLNWLEQRTGLVGLARRFLFAPLPGGARWRYTWVAMLGFTFFVQVVTGFFLLTHYSASTQSAWESVFFLQYLVPGGNVLRGLHHYSAQLFVVLLVLHLAQTIVYRAYLAPREIPFWLLLLLLPLAMGLSVTGWMLPFDQKGYWAANVPLNILSVVPLVGSTLRQLLIGGTEIGHLTLTRFVALHWRLGRPTGEPSRPQLEGSAPSYWPHQALKDVLACGVVLLVILGCVFWPWLMRGQAPGVALMAPADPSEPFGAARPEWFMLWLFQFLKYFPGGTEVWGAVVIPTLVFLLLAGLPWIGRRRRGAIFARTVLMAGAAGVVLLALLAWNADRQDAHYQAAIAQAQSQAARVRALALSDTGIPPTGALTLLQTDPWTQGPRLFARHCASCHRFDGHDGTGHATSDPQSASDLKGYASREWLTRFLTLSHLTSSNYFGGTKFAGGKMVRFVKKNLVDLEPAEKAQLQKMILAVSAEAELPGQFEADQKDAALIAEGRQLMVDADFACTDCHQFRKPDEDAIAPDLTGYGSRAWLIAFISDPAHERFYGKKNDRMPAFGTDGLLDSQAIGLLADWLRGTRPEAAP